MGVDEVTSPLNRAVFLDRDGVINGSRVENGTPLPPNDPKNVTILPGVAESLELLKKAGFYRIVVTNQPDIARGTQTRTVVEAINRHLHSRLEIDDFYVCYHDDSDQCSCRKPKPGLLIQAAENYGIELTRSYMVGDRWRDIDAGKNAGCCTILIDYNYGERDPEHSQDKSVKSLYEAVNWILITEKVEE